MTAVLLEPPLSRSGPNPYLTSDRTRVALTHGPLLLRTRGMGRWHRPRSGSTWTSSYDGEEITSYSLWCGQQVGSGRKTTTGQKGFIACASLPDDGVPICGTCEGRAIGAGHQGTAATVTSPAGLLFEPERLVPPKLCPGTALRLYDTLPGNRAALCLACGNVEPLRGYSNASGGWENLQRHPPGPNLVQGCPFHGWRGMVRDGDTVRCECAGGR